MENFSPQIQSDIKAVASISVVPSILEVICRTTGMGFSAVARVTDEKWICCAVRDEIAFGLGVGGELVLESTICHEIRQSGQGVIIDHVELDSHFRTHHTPAMYGFQSYISIPIIRKNGDFFGTLCAIDPKPHVLNTTETINMFKLFAELISFHLDASDKLAISEKSLLEERETAELRDQFIAILGHDLLNPVGAVLNVAQLLLRIPSDERVTRMANIVQDSAYRMKALIENILDFARGRLGEGIILKRGDNEPLEDMLTKVLTELRIIWPNRIIETNFDFSAPVNCDGRRIAQLFSNILGNALSHGEKDMPVMVEAVSKNEGFTLSVTNSGHKIPTLVMERLFHPFYRGEVDPHKEGLGLGLYISSEIARAHGGALTVKSTDENTCFTLWLPAC
ncbi:GAF domain-containing sensor histidine kinase [Mucilaginibacter flavus]|uniref:GAF domain-containing sensor histidine kinase n=1 Tax=Mucilaginibacter flavus TaxID=931504 RepID=UPI0025B600DD|nr:GAF domain-containing sensor histidine kinase [Mucilaginibacter flavus]MDN3579694.1 GAF domain-containing sensor histidine kinase [Mucilaginibacter flavus]